MTEPAIWGAIGDTVPTDDELSRFTWALHRHRVLALRLETCGAVAAGLWDSLTAMPYDLFGKHPATRCTGLERWGPTGAALIRGDQALGVTRKAHVGKGTTMGPVGVLVYWPGAEPADLSLARDLGARTVKIVALRPVGES
jgi:hypothetical protein